MSPDGTTTTCYRHPGREAPLRCTRCERPICLEDAIDAPVGYLCPDDAQQSRRVRRVAAGASADVTRGLVVVLVVVFVLQVTGAFQLTGRALTEGPLIARGQWWRVVTGAFVHADLMHIGFNGYLLYRLGRMLERRLGRSRFAAIYVAGLAGGSAGVLLLSWRQPTLGASGAVFGLMGAAMVLLRRHRDISPWQTDIGTLLLFNLVLTFLVPQISIGGHLGGLAGGALAAAVLVARTDRRGTGAVGPWVVAAGLLALAFLAGFAGPLLPALPLIG